MNIENRHHVLRSNGFTSVIVPEHECNLPGRPDWSALAVSCGFHESWVDSVSVGFIYGSCDRVPAHAPGRVLSIYKTVLLRKNLLQSHSTLPF